MLRFIQHHLCSHRILYHHSACCLHSTAILCSSGEGHFSSFQGFEFAIAHVLENVGFIHCPNHVLCCLFGHHFSGKGEYIIYNRVVLRFIQHHLCSQRILHRYVACSLHFATILCSSGEGHFSSFQGFELAVAQVLEDVGIVHRPNHVLCCLFWHYLSGKGEYIIYNRVVLRFIQHHLCSQRILHRYVACSLHFATILCSSGDGHFSSFQGFELAIAHVLENVDFIHRPNHVLRSLFWHYFSGKGEYIVYNCIMLSFVQHHLCSHRILHHHSACSLHFAAILCSSCEDHFSSFQGFELAVAQVLEDVGFIHGPHHVLCCLFGHYFSGKGEDIVHSRVVLRFIQHHLCSLGDLGFLFLYHHVTSCLRYNTINRHSSDCNFTSFQGFELTISDHVQNTRLAQVPRHLLVSFLG